jgi:hypothetical protein
MAYLQPEVAMNSLMKKSTPTKELSRIREPAARIRARPTVSFGRRRLGKFTKPGSKDWLEKTYTIVKNSIEDDYAVAYDYQTGLRGESSFLTGANKPIPNGCNRPTFLNLKTWPPTPCISSQRDFIADGSDTDKPEVSRKHSAIPKDQESNQ